MKYKNPTYLTLVQCDGIDKIQHSILLTHNNHVY